MDIRQKLLDILDEAGQFHEYDAVGQAIDAYDRAMAESQEHYGEGPWQVDPACEFFVGRPPLTDEELECAMAHLQENP